MTLSEVDGGFELGCCSDLYPILVAFSFCTGFYLHPSVAIEMVLKNIGLKTNYFLSLINFPITYQCVA
jgi:hypothetical protein